MNIPRGAWYPTVDQDGNHAMGLSVHDAADIWASNGKDEDYTFGFSEAELQAALDED
jgi:hypothetical protein